MLWMLNEHHVLPGTYYRLPEGEKTVIRACYEKIMQAHRD